MASIAPNKQKKFSKKTLIIVGIAVLILNAILVAVIWNSLDENSNDEPILTTVEAAGDTETVKIRVGDSGLFRLTPNDFAALGWDVAAEQLQLSQAGVPIPVWAGEGDYAGDIYFYVKANTSRYFGGEVLLMSIVPASESSLQKSEGLHQENGATSETAVLQTLRFEQNESYYPQAAGFDNWFWTILPSPTSKEFTADLDVVPGHTGRFRLQLFATTQNASLNPDHHIQLYANDKLIADEYWDGQGWQLMSGELAPGILQAGENIIRLEAPGDTGSLVDISQLDWLELDVPVSARAPKQGALAFTALGTTVSLENFDEAPLVLELSETASMIPVVRRLHVIPQGAAWTMFVDSDHQYLAAEPSKMQRPSSIEPLDTALDLRAPDIGADYLVIGPIDLISSTEPLLEHRRRYGLSTRALAVGSIYDQFNFGRPEPEAVVRFLQHAWATWESPPQYLLLLGDASHDPKGYQSDPSLNMLPAFVIQTSHGGETASDLHYAYVDQDLVPDLSIGRVPARSSVEVESFVNKTLLYEASLPRQDENWNPRVLAVADNSEESFYFDAQEFLDQFDPVYERVLYAPKNEAQDSGTVIASHLEDGVLIMSYFGHGSLLQWGKNSLFTAEDGLALTNERLPIMINITCLAGLFSHPQVNSLAESMLFNPEGGAVAALAATSLTTPPDQAELTRALVSLLNKHPNLTLGQLLLLTYQDIAPQAHYGVREVIETFLLFGNPALRLTSGSG